MKFVNLMQHEIVVRRPNDDDLVIPPSGDLARVESHTSIPFTIDGINVSRTSFGTVIGIPDPIPGVIFLVSTLVAQRANRFDVLSP